MIRLQFIDGVRDSEFKLKVLEALRLMANDNLTVDERTASAHSILNPDKRFAESSVDQSVSSVDAYAEKRGNNSKKICVAVRSQNSASDWD